TATPVHGREKRTPGSCKQGKKQGERHLPEDRTYLHASETRSGRKARLRAAGPVSVLLKTRAGTSQSPSDQDIRGPPVPRRSAAPPDKRLQRSFRSRSPAG